MTKQSNVRKVKNFLIKKDIQLKIALTNLIYMFLVFLVSIVIILYPYITDMFLSSELEVQYQAANLFIILSERLLPAIAVIFIVAFLHQILITHQICGPLVNFSNTLKLISQGDFSRKIMLRKNDLLQIEATYINEMIDDFSALINSLKADNLKLLSEMKTCESTFQEKNSIHKDILKIEEDIRQFHEKLSKIKLS